MFINGIMLRRLRLQQREIQHLFSCIFVHAIAFTIFQTSMRSVIVWINNCEGRARFGFSRPGGCQQRNHIVHSAEDLARFIRYEVRCDRTSTRDYNPLLYAVLLARRGQRFARTSQRHVLACFERGRPESFARTGGLG